MVSHKSKSSGWSLIRVSARGRFNFICFLGYLVFGLAWIFLSDRLLIFFPDPAHMVELSTIKGVFFILLTSIFLLFALQNVPERDEIRGIRNNYSSRIVTLAGNSPLWLVYVLSLILMAATLLLRMEVAEGVQNRPLLILLMLPIIASSALGGLGPGLLSTAIAALSIKLLAIPHIYTVAFQHTADLFQWSFLVINGVLAAILCELLRKAQAQAERRRLQQEVVQEALRQSEQKFRSLFQNIADPVYIADREGRILAANDQACQEMGYTPGEMLQLRIMDLDAQDDTHEKMVARFAELQKMGAATLESRHKRKDGTQFPVEINIRSFDFAGQQCLLGVARNLSERRRAEEALAESEKRFRSMVEGAPDPIFIQIDGKFAYLNPEGSQLFGATEAHDLIGMPVVERVHPEYHDLARERIRRLNVDRQRVTEIQEFRMLRMDGSEIWVETKGEPIVYGGKNGALIFVRDVTERRKAQEALRQSEARFKALADFAPVGVVISDLNDKVVFLNQRFTELLGYTIDDVPTIGDWWPLAYPDEQLREAIRRSWADTMGKAAAHGLPVEPAERPVRCRDGSIRHIEFHKGSSGNLNFVIMTDVSLRKQAEAAVFEKAEDLRITLKSIGDAVITTNTQGRITNMNRVAETLTGWKASDVEQRPLEQVFVIFNSTTGEPVENPATTVIQSGQNVQLANHTKLLAKDGREYQISDSAAPILDEQGIMRGVVLVFRDVTESYAMREMIRRERNILQLFIRYSPAAIAMFDCSMRYLAVSERFLKDYNIQETEIIGRSHYEIFPEISESIKEVHRRCLAGAVERCPEATFLRADGRTDWVRWEIRPWYETSGNIGGVLLFSEVITESIVAREALLESERKIRFALETAGMGGWDLNLLDHTVHRSAIHDRIFGYSELLPEWKYEKFLEHVHPEDRSRIEESLLEAVSAASDWNAECRIYRCDGELRWIWFSGRYFLDKHDSTPHIAGFVQDITEGKRNKEHIDHTSHVLDAIRLINKLIVYEQDPQTLLQRACNLLIETRGYRTAWAAVYGEKGQLTISAESGIGEDFTKLLTAMQDGDKPHCYDLVSKEATGVVSILDIEARCAACPLVRRYRDGAALIGALRHNEREYGILAVALPAGMADDENELSLFQELASDLGYALYSLEQKEKRTQAEDLYSLLFISSTDGILIADTLTKRFRFANPAICAFLGYSQEELLSQDVSAIHPQEDLPEILARFDSLVRGERVLFEDIPCQRKDGSVVYADVNAAPIVIEGNRCLAGFFRDITARKLAEKEHEKLEKQLLQAQKMESVGQLAGGVAHDYNNMLNVILGYTEMALESIDKDLPLYDELTEVMSAALRSAEITRQLLAFARKQTIAPVILDLNDTIAGMLKMLQRLIGENINLSWNPKPGLWLVKMDPSQIDQILANLCVNARDAIADVGRITIETDNVMLDEHYCLDHSGCMAGDYVMLSVSDTGCGMDKATLEKIFEPFYTTKEVGKGTGLGMSTVYGIVKQNGGSISVYSEPKMGTTIKIFMPRHQRAEQTVSAKETYTISKGKGELLLLVEDDGTVRRMGKTMLERAGYAVLAAASPDEAITLAKTHTGKIDLLISDVVMPEMNGKQLADRLLSLNPGLKVLFMSGYTANAIAHHGVLEEGVNFLQKPFTHKELTGKVRALLDNIPPQIR